MNPDYDYIVKLENEGTQGEEISSFRFNDENGDMEISLKGAGDIISTLDGYNTGDIFPEYVSGEEIESIERNSEGDITLTCKDGNHYRTYFDGYVFVKYR